MADKEDPEGARNRGERPGKTDGTTTGSGAGAGGGGSPEDYDNDPIAGGGDSPMPRHGRSERGDTPSGSQG